jgi:hypothetical protein
MLDDSLFFTDMVMADISNFSNIDLESDREEL